MIFSHDARGLPTTEHEIENSKLLLRPNYINKLVVRYGFSSWGADAALACNPCWLQAQRLTQVCNCSQKQSRAKILLNRAAPS
jgi:hypothetical protein